LQVFGNEVVQVGTNRAAFFLDDSLNGFVLRYGEAKGGRDDRFRVNPSEAGRVKALLAPLQLFEVSKADRVSVDREVADFATRRTGGPPVGHVGVQREDEELLSCGGVKAAVRVVAVAGLTEVGLADRYGAPFAELRRAANPYGLKEFVREAGGGELFGAKFLEEAGATPPQAFRELLTFAGVFVVKTQRAELAPR